LYKDWVFWIVVQNLTNFADRGIDAVVGIQEDVLTPDPSDDVLSGDQLPPALEQQEQDLHGDSLQLQSATRTAQFIGAPVQFKLLSESHHVRRHIPTTLNEEDHILHHLYPAATTIIFSAV
jgi:hypothetical protein